MGDKKPLLLSNSQLHQGDHYGPETKHRHQMALFTLALATMLYACAVSKRRAVSKPRAVSKRSF